MDPVNPVGELKAHFMINVRCTVSYGKDSFSFRHIVEYAGVLNAKCRSLIELSMEMNTLKFKNTATSIVVFFATVGKLESCRSKPGGYSALDWLVTWPKIEGRDFISTVKRKSIDRKKNKATDHKIICDDRKRSVCDREKAHHVQRKVLSSTLIDRSVNRLQRNEP